MRFSKIKYNGMKVELTWVTKEEDGTVTEHTCRSHEKPLTPFTDAMEAFAPLAGKCLDFTAKYSESLDITGVSINTVEKTNTRGMVLSFRKDVSGAKAPFFGNTPHLAEGPDGEEGPGYIGEKWWAALADLERAAEAYVKGEREQGELPLGEGDEGEDGDAE